MAETEQPRAPRLASLDALRGFTIVGMLMVNNPGADEAFPDQLRHAPWGQFVTFCDMIFPWFLFMVGVALPFSVAAFHKRNPGAGLSGLMAKAAQRAATLVFLGILIDCSVTKKITVGLNVLQLIGLAFLLATPIHAALPRWKGRAATALAMLVAYWALIRFLPIPGVGAGFFEEEKNIIATINGVLRPYHLAGILSTVPAAALVLIGTMIGDLIRDQEVAVPQRLKLLFGTGAALTVAGLIWHLDLEMSKHVWTPSYILFAAGLGTVLLAGFHIAIDLCDLRRWAFPFIVFGSNAIAAYWISIMVRIHTVQEWTITAADGSAITLWRAWQQYLIGNLGTVAGGWTFTLVYITFWFFVLLWMYRRKIFWKV